MPRSVVDAGENDHQHGKHSRLQQAQARERRNEAQHQCCKFRHKKAVPLQLMDGGPSKINPPNSHPSNPIHKAAMAAQSPRPKKEDVSEEKETASEKPPNKTPQHEINKTAAIIGVVGIVPCCLWRRVNAFLTFFQKEMQPPPKSKARYVQRETRWPPQQI